MKKYNTLIAEMLIKLTTQIIQMQLKKEDRALEKMTNIADIKKMARHGIILPEREISKIGDLIGSESGIRTTDDPLDPQFNSAAPEENVEIPKAKEMEITVKFMALSDSGKAYRFDWEEGKRAIWLPKSLVDNMNKGFVALLTEFQIIKVPTNIMRDK